MIKRMLVRMLFALPLAAMGAGTLGSAALAQEVYVVRPYDPERAEIERDYARDQLEARMEMRRRALEYREELAHRAIDRDEEE
jgi:hypothetical protein